MQNGIKRPVQDAEPRFISLCALLIVVVAQYLSHQAWFDRDARIPFWDQDRYFDMTRTAHDRLGANDFLTVLDLHPSHPPLYSLLGAAFQGSGELRYDHVRRINIWLGIATTLLTFALARRLGSSRLEAALAGALSALFPLAYSFTHMYYIENLLTPLVLSAMILLWPPGPKRLHQAAFAGFLLGLACLCKWTAPAFLMVPTLAALWTNRKQVPHLVVATLALLATMGPWYVTHWQGIVSFLDSGVTAGEGNLSAIRGIEAVAYYPVKLVFLGVGPLAALLSLFGLARIWRADSRRAALLILVILCAVILFSAILTKKPRHLLPLLPCLAVLAASGAWAIRTAATRSAVVVVLIAGLVLANASHSFGVPKSLPEWRIGGVTVPLLARSSGAGVHDSRVWPYDAMIDAILPSSATDASPQQVLVLFNLVPFREGGFRYHLQNRSVPLWCSLIPFAGLVKDDRFPLLRSDEETPGLLDLPPLFAKSGPVWVRYQSGVQAHRHGSRVSEHLQDPVGALTDSYEIISEHPLPDGSLGRVYRAKSADARSLARLALIYDPDDIHGWNALGVSPPEDQRGRLLLLVDLMILPPDFVGGTDESTTDLLSRCNRLVSQHGNREECLALVTRVAPKGSPPELLASELLTLWEEYRTGDSLLAALQMAKLHREAGHPKALAIRWLRRAAECAGGRESIMRAGLLAHEIAVDSENLVSALRDMDRLNEQR